MRPAGKTVGIPSDIAFSFGGRIHLMRPDGLQRKGLTGGRPVSFGAGDVQPAWAPDGRRLAFVRTSKPSAGRSRIYLLDVASGRSTALTPGGKEIQSIDPAWSPDGRQIAYTRWNARGEEGENAIVVAQADGSGERVLRRTGLDGEPDVMGQPAWSPDGTRILYTRSTIDRRYTFRPSLHVMDAATGDSRPLAEDAADGAWSPDGRRIAFSGVRDRNGKWCYEQCTISGEIYVMDSDGTNLERLTRNRGNDTAPSWSPDGSRIVFESNRNVRDAPPSQGTEIYSIPRGRLVSHLAHERISLEWRPGLARQPVQLGSGGRVRSRAAPSARGRRPRGPGGVGPSSRVLARQAPWERPAGKRAGLCGRTAVAAHLRLLLRRLRALRRARLPPGTPAAGGLRVLAPDDPRRAGPGPLPGRARVEERQDDSWSASAGES